MFLDGKCVFMRNIKGIFRTLSKTYDKAFCENIPLNPLSTEAATGGVL